MGIPISSKFRFGRRDLSVFAACKDCSSMPVGSEEASAVASIAAFSSFRIAIACSGSIRKNSRLGLTQEGPNAVWSATSTASQSST